ncbi:hypothetical protein QEN19_001979 [Hanseniaspora menglaensis]
MSDKSSSVGSHETVASQVIEKKIIFNENTPNARFNQSLLWPSIIKLPENKWIFRIETILENLNKNGNHKKIRSFIKYCIEFLYNCKKDLSLQDHTFTCMTLLFYRYWMLEGSDNLIKLDLDSLGRLILVIIITSCKTMENHRKVNQYVEVVVSKSNPTVKSMTVLDKKKWHLRENLLNDEMDFLAKMKFDLNIVNAKNVLDEFYGFYAKYNIDSNDEIMKNDLLFKSQFSLLIKDCKGFITNSMTQPISLICDGYDFVQYSLIFSAFNFNQQNKLNPSDDKYFKFTPNFFSRKFKNVLSPKQLIYICETQFLLEKNFLSNKTNKGDQLLKLTEDTIETLLDETDLKASGTLDLKKRPFKEEDSQVDLQMKKQKVTTEKQDFFEKDDAYKNKLKLDASLNTLLDDSVYLQILNKVKNFSSELFSKPVESSCYYAENVIDDVSPEYLKFIEKRINASYEQDAKMQQQHALK